MADRITSAQLRGARGMLDWSIVDLARAASISVSTVKRIETAGLEPVSDDMREIVRVVLERAGVAFLDDEVQGVGLRLRAS